MLIKIDCSGKGSSIFICDRCKARLLSNERVTVRAYRAKQQTTIKKWDLCPICYKKLYKGIEKYKITE